MTDKGRAGMRGARTALPLMMLLGAWLVGTASPAAAGTPEHFSDHFEFDGNINDVVPCDFGVSERFVEDLHGMTTFDANGEAVRTQITIKATAWFTNEDTGFSVMDRDSFPVTIDERTGSVTVVGISFHINIPGEGIVVLQAGRVTFDADGSITFLAGPHDQYATDGQALCDALS
jgi:hypothetical protein